MDTGPSKDGVGISVSHGRDIIGVCVCVCVSSFDMLWLCGLGSMWPLIWNRLLRPWEVLKLEIQKTERTFKVCGDNIFLKNESSQISQGKRNVKHEELSQ